MAYLGDRTESDVIATQRKVKDLVRESISRQPAGEPKFFVDAKVFNLCWPKIWQWLNVQSLGGYLLKYDIIKDPTDLFSLNNNYFTPRQKADSLLSLVHQGGLYGYHMLYLCILEDDENPLGHADAAQTLMDCARRTRTVPPLSLSGNDAVPSHFNQHGSPVERDGPSGQGHARNSSPAGQGQYSHPVATSSVTSNPHFIERRDLSAVSAESLQYPVQEDSTSLQSTARHGEPFAQDVSSETGRWPQQRQMSPQYSPAELSSDGRGSVSNNPPSFPYDTARSESNQLDSAEMLIHGGRYLHGDDSEVDGPVSASSRHSVTVNGTASMPLHHRDSSSATSEGDVAGQPLPHVPPPLSKEDIMRTMRDMISCRRLNDQLLPDGCALEVLGSNDFDTKDDIMDETIKFLVSCLNSRAVGVSCGVLVAGADYQLHSPQEVKLGLVISGSDLRILQARFYNLLRRRILVQTMDNRVEPAQSLESLTRLEVVSVATQVGSERTPAVVVILVVPDISICKDHLYLYNSPDSRRRHVYKRTEDGQVKINSQKQGLLHRQLAQHYNQRHH